MCKNCEKARNLLTKKAYDAVRKEEWHRLKRTVRLITKLESIIEIKREYLDVFNNSAITRALKHRKSHL